MKKAVFLLTAILLLTTECFSQSGGTCSTAISIPNSTGYVLNQVQTATDQWFVYHDTVNAKLNLTVENDVDTLNFNDSVTIFVGTCSNLNRIGASTIQNYSQTFTANAIILNAPRDVFFHVLRNSTPIRC
ncbi:MAG TPA: hypothetical protein VL651_00910 [Bacteroidia bacterium]|jgi:hypothetical protein|nr:hypothetical protein [Bacteroidia bacterium]